MTDKLKWAGWMISFFLFGILCLQKSCTKNKDFQSDMIHDTLTIKGDSHLIKVQDTIFTPSKTVYVNVKNFLPIDTAVILKDYFATRTYMDTIKSRDVMAVIKDSIMDNKLAGRKVLIENTRDKQLPEIFLKPKNKLLLGGFIGLSQLNLQPVAGFSISFITKNDVMYSYHFELISRTHLIGVSWKLKFPKLNAVL